MKDVQREGLMGIFIALIFVITLIAASCDLFLLTILGILALVFYGMYIVPEYFERKIKRLK